ncbi:RNA pseudouridine synthase [Amphritea opalescens]|uniref:RNA pseudouridine synthase n=1 Tax=Amphritea opalescens TaxID=2490544 RepID=A0A430KQI0_9GAMM|nr:RNA pseudouridine synthase [Amphritea opalescens]RTE65732.1 RNA pseudouridine synthase [Amphritea opalescens]
MEPFKLSFKVTDYHHLTVAEFLQDRLANGDIDRLPQLCAEGHVYADEYRMGLDDGLNNVSELRVMLPYHQEEPVDDRWLLLWQNRELMAVFKPHNLPVSRTTRNLYNTLISLVRRQTPYCDARLLHRLDSETSGVILLAKDADADRRWKPRLNELIEKKLYQAWVEGVPSWSSKRMECRLSERLGSAIRSQVYVIDETDVSDHHCFLKPRLSQTLFRVLGIQAGRALLECQLITGRKHQIRAQLSDLGHPVVGDKIYAHEGRFYLKRIEQGLDQEDLSVLGAEHHLLQAVALTLNVDGDEVQISVPESRRLRLL